ncbi:hypothetical protein [Glycomyces sp. NRRL B-16210]|uniref:hypothetical protein n=1 Tax=Glycomyces sp. NRRL B-16210 TaxID=1463821 RepID=UPI000A511B88|nr:hypothetical protein [Glycomyces sp. NRRL B-16210]
MKYAVGDVVVLDATAWVPEATGDFRLRIGGMPGDVVSVMDGGEFVVNGAVEPPSTASRQSCDKPFRAGVTESLLYDGSVTGRT